MLSINTVRVVSNCILLMLLSGSSVVHVLAAPAVQAVPPVEAAVAVAGSPFGVLVANLPLPAGFQADSVRVLVSDAEKRVFYPVVTIRKSVVVRPRRTRPRGIGRPGGLLDRVRGAIRGEDEKREVPVGVTVAALFRGTRPIELVVTGDVNQKIRISIAPTDERRHSELLSSWWESYVASAREATATDDFPKLIHRYLLAMLSQRLGLPAADLDPPDPDAEEPSQMVRTLSLLAGIDSLREEILESVLTIPGESKRAELPVPADPVWDESALQQAPAQTETEPLASRVPPECFYLRFGSFNNYVWFQDLSTRFGGDISQAVLMRGFNHEASARMEKMLAAKMTTLAKMFGDKIIQDMAVIGSDLYMKEGASLGVVFQSNNSGLLSSTIESDRRSVAARNDDASVRKVTIANRSVSFLSTPDNRIRSFMVQDGNFVFVTTSETLMRRFLEVGSGDRSLAQVDAFRWARTWMPDNNKYSVFAYFSPAFFHRLVSPQYQIELNRRLEAVAHLEVVELASHTAAAEGIEANRVSDLKNAGLVPAWFDVRADGAQVIRMGDRWIDSLRGGRGSFLPIADVPLAVVSEAESAKYGDLTSFYEEQWKQTDPLLIGLRRFQEPGQASESVAFEGYLAPFEAEKYGWIAKQLAKPSALEVRQPVDNAASVQLHIRGDAGLGQAAEDYHLFAGVKDMVPPEPGDTKGLIKTLQTLKATPAYIGAWPMPGLIENLPLGLGLARPDYAGFTRMIAGLWRWQNGEFSVLSFDRSIIENAIPQLVPVPSTDTAQARLEIADLSGSKLATWINRRWYQRGWRASHGNTQLLESVHQQLKVPIKDCMVAAENLLDVKLQCPLGGEYEYLETASGSGQWASTAWENAANGQDGSIGPPQDYVAPWVMWFRGAKVHVTQQEKSLSVVGSVALEMPPLPPELESDTPSVLPAMDFNLFQLPMQLFGGGEETSKAKRQSF